MLIIRSARDPKPTGWAPVRYWLRRAGCRSVALTFPALVEALRLAPDVADRVRMLPPGGIYARMGAGDVWCVTRLEGS